MKASWIRPLFMLAGLYDFVLGAAFFLAHKTIYARFQIEPPNHEAYVLLPAALIAIFGLGFWMVASAPERNRDIIGLGVLMKLAFAAIVLSFAFRGAIPAMWVPFAWIDLAFMLAFIAAHRSLAPARA